ncbi:hypothetical protein [Paludisphaera borealis]|uniref:hypothetical protein n=1 Tax=Paludisphaera borealis TaxID=1387353 RepID=UPI0011AB6564|nr:hypothetical protein [Paludisphaera borealis]
MIKPKAYLINHIHATREARILGVINENQLGSMLDDLKNIGGRFHGLGGEGTPIIGAFLRRERSFLTVSPV